MAKTDPAPQPTLASQTSTSEPWVAQDGRRSGSEFVENLGRNCVGVFSQDNLQTFLIGTGATVSARLLDDKSQRFFGGQRRAKWLGDTAEQFGRMRFVAPATLILYGLGRASHDQTFRDASYDIAQTTILTAAFTVAIKTSAHRLRPDGSNYRSFPSGHSSNSFAWATVFNHFYGPAAGIPAYGIAGLVGIGRMEKNVHYLSDVVAGAALGILISRTVIRKNDEPLPGTTVTTGGLPPALRSRPLIQASIDF